MVARHLRPASRAPIDLPPAAAATVATALLALLVSHRAGGLGLLAPLVVVLAGGDCCAEAPVHGDRGGGPHGALRGTRALGF